jgi:hypothetical protein
MKWMFEIVDLLRVIGIIKPKSIIKNNKEYE